MKVTIVVLAATFAYAGNEGYFTSYNHHMHKGEVELMFMSDYTLPSKFKKDEGQKNYLSQMLELEYGLSSVSAVEIMPEWWYEPSTGRGEFTRGRLEYRTRVFEEEKFINPMVYAEFEYLKKSTRFKMETSGWIVSDEDSEEGVEPNYERILETRIILSKDFGGVNVTFNWINETDVHAGGTAFGYSIGVMYHPHGGSGCMCKTDMPDCGCAHCKGEPVACPCHMEGHGGIMYGFEIIGALGDSSDFGFDLDRQEHYFQPIMGFSLGNHVMVHVAVAIGLSEASDNLIRLAIGYEF